MSDSLLVAGIETLGGTSQSTYKISTGGLQFGAPEPDQATVASLLLDGDVVTGIRAKNRSITLPITVFATGATSQAIRSALTAACDALLAAVDTATFTLQWTPDGGLPIIWDCYRARGERQRSIVRDNQGVTMVTLTFQAKPYGRSPVAQTVAAAGSTLQIDSFDTAPTGATLVTGTKYEGTGSAQFHPDGNPVSRSFAAVDLSTYTNISLRYNMGGAGTNAATWHLTLSSASGSTRYTIPFTLISNNRWQVVYASLSGGTILTGTGVTLSAVTSYTLDILRPSNTTIAILIDDMRAGASATSIIGPTTHAAVLAVPVTSGSARTPVNLTLSNNSTFSAFLLHSPPDDQDPAAAILNSLSGSVTDQTITIARASVNPVLNGSFFAGTYGLYLGVSTVGGGTVTVTVTVQQQQAGSNIGTPKTLTKTYTSGMHIVPVGGIALPIYDVPDDNNTTGYTIRVQITGADRYTEVMLCDTRGQTIYTDTDLGTAVNDVWVNEPTALQSAPRVYFGNASNVAINAIGNCWITGGPILFESGANKLLAWVNAATPLVAATYYPRWQDERVS